jgi:hypothetical protein
LCKEFLPGRSVLGLDHLLPKLEVFGPEVSTRPEAEIGFTKGSKGRDDHYGIGWEMVRL